MCGLEHVGVQTHNRQCVSSRTRDHVILRGSEQGHAGFIRQKVGSLPTTATVTGDRPELIELSVE